MYSWIIFLVSYIIRVKKLLVPQSKICRIQTKSTREKEIEQLQLHAMRHRDSKNACMINEVTIRNYRPYNLIEVFNFPLYISASILFISLFQHPLTVIYENIGFVYADWEHCFVVCIFTIGYMAYQSERTHTQCMQEHKKRAHVQFPDLFHFIRYLSRSFHSLVFALFLVFVKRIIVFFYWMCELASKWAFVVDNSNCKWKNACILIW